MNIYPDLPVDQCSSCGGHGKVRGIQTDADNWEPDVLCVSHFPDTHNLTCEGRGYVINGERLNECGGATYFPESWLEEFMDLHYPVQN